MMSRLKKLQPKVALTRHGRQFLLTGKNGLGSGGGAAQVANTGGGRSLAGAASIGGGV